MPDDPNPPDYAPALTKALSIQQPYAWLIAAGHKDIENRDWPTRFRGPVLIHAGKRMYDGFEDGQDLDWPKIERPCDFDMGGIIGEAEIVDRVTSSKSPWFFGRYGFVFRNARLLPFRPCRGQLGFFVPDFRPSAPKPPKPTRTRGALLI